MAANSSSRGIASFGKRVADQIWSRSSSLSSSVAVASRRAAHTSTYDKNVDEHSHPSHAVPDELIQPNSDKYWAPHPQTGVFGPASAAGEGRGFQAATPTNDNSAGSVLEQKAWFRPTSIEDLEKPAMH